jgi:hypothetical protein
VDPQDFSPLTSEEWGVGKKVGKAKGRGKKVERKLEGRWRKDRGTKLLAFSI